jgi:hypothetical protein
MAPKSTRESPPQLATENRTVTDLRVRVQREMRRVEGHLALDQASQLAKARTEDTGLAIPKDPVVHDEEVGARGNRSLDDRFASIDRHSDALHFRRAFHLKAIVGSRIVGEGPYVQVLVEILQE